MTRQRFFLVTASGETITCEPVPTPDDQSGPDDAGVWWRGDGSGDPEPYVPSPGVPWCHYPGWACAILLSVGGETGRWLRPSLLEDLFDRMGWDPDVVTCWAAVEGGPRRAERAVVSADGFADVVCPIPGT